MNRRKNNENIKGPKKQKKSKNKQPGIISRIPITLNTKFTFVIILAITMTAAVLAAADEVETRVAETAYKSQEAMEKNLGVAYDSLETYIVENKIKGTDAEGITKWVGEHDYTYLYVYDNFKSTFDGGWQSTPEKSKTRQGLKIGKTPDDQRKRIEESIGSHRLSEEERKEDRISEKYFKEDLQNRIVNFADGPYYVYMDIYKQEHWYSIMFVIKVILSCIVFFAILLIYNAKMMNRIINISGKVRRISDGELDLELAPRSNDEIGRLTKSVDIMRNSILEKLENEQEAWDANTKLITAMSHDIRTPLTSLIGYLDIIEGGKYKTEEDLNKYISTCRDKAFQLKDLSDKLFQYFLVFGSKESDMNLEKFDAGILLQQLIYEHTAELMNYDYKIDFDYNVPEVEIMADLSAMQRLFDNLFSNIMKYGDKKYHVSINAFYENGMIVIRLLNSINEESKKVESNKIGLKTCEKICCDMGGNFVYSDSGSSFSVRVELPEHVEKNDGTEKCETKENITQGTDIEN